MEAVNSLNFNLIVIVLISGLSQQVPTVESNINVGEVFSKFNFHGKSGLLQFWACSKPSNSNSSSDQAVGCNLLLTGQPFELTLDHEGLLQDYRRGCLENRNTFFELHTNVGNWLAARAVQTQIADHRTIRHVTVQEDQHSALIGGMGQLVLPVFNHQGVLEGIIEFVTPVPKESYVEDFEQVHNLLKDVGLKSTYMGKTIKVEYKNDLIKFTLPLSAKLTDLHTEVKRRLHKLEHQKILCIKYKDTNGNHIPILSDQDLEDCMKESSSEGAKFIRMCI